MARNEEIPFEDAALVEQCRQGDVSAYGRLVAIYQDRVFNTCWRICGNRADAEETTQEVFINVFTSLGSFRAEAPFAAWVLGIARRTVANRFKKKHHPTVPLDTTDEPDPTELSGSTLQRRATPLEVYEYNERLEQLESAANLYRARKLLLAR